MDHDAELVTVLADGDGLGAPTTATHIGAAPGGRGQLRGAVPSWGSASTQGPGQAAEEAGEWRGGKALSALHNAQAVCQGQSLINRRCPMAGRVGWAQGSAQLGAVAVPRAEPGWGSWPRTRCPRVLAHPQGR
jgi:hypothetical protein